MKSENLFAIAIITVGILISIALLLIASNIDKFDPLELQLILAFTTLMIAEIKLFIPIYILIFCIGIFWSFVPKSTDDPIIRLVKTIGIAGGLLIALIITAILR